MKQLANYLFCDLKQTKEISWFRNALYSLVLYKVFIYIIQFNTLFSDERLIYKHAHFGNPIINSVFFLNNYYSVALGAFFILVIALCAVIGLLKKSTYITNLLLWLLMMNVSSFIYMTTDAGDYFLNQLLLFNCFFLPKNTKSSIINDFKTVLHNGSLAILKLQVCFAYAVSAYLKIIDPSWTGGMAIHQIFQIPQYSNIVFQSVPAGICVVLTYATLCYQLLFPFLVWVRAFKIYLLVFGISLHLCIAFGMGLVGFGLVMIISYILFLKYDN